jgi:hypothetical protein
MLGLILCLPSWTGLGVTVMRGHARATSLPAPVVMPELLLEPQVEAL